MTLTEPADSAASESTDDSPLAPHDPQLRATSKMGQQIKVRYWKVREGHQRTVREAIEFGHLLNNTKIKMEHGDWEKFLLRYVPELALSTARSYMQLARYHAEHPEKRVEIERSSIESVLTRLRKPKTKTPDSSDLGKSKHKGRGKPTPQPDASNPLDDAGSDKERAQAVVCDLLALDRRTTGTHAVTARQVYGNLTPEQSEQLAPALHRLVAFATQMLEATEPRMAA